jgi:multidomain signaling protein FimX
LEKKILRLLIVDDSPDDAEIAVAALRKGGYMLKSQRTQDLLGLQTAIEKGEWDVIISEYQLPHFGAALVLEWLKRAQLDIPLIVLARAIRDPEIVKIMQAGARDVIAKNQSARLLPAIEREVAVAAERAEYRRAMQALKEVEHKHRAVIESAREAICYSQDGMHVNANKAYLDMFEYETLDELEGVPLMNLVDKTDQARFKEFMRKSGATSGGPQEFLAVRKSGARLQVEMALSQISIDGEPCMQVLVTDISKRRAVETKLRYLNEHDPLTGLYNRHYFSQELDRTVERVQREGVTAGVVYTDFTDLRQVSKTLGHTTADRFLLAAARTLRETFGERAVLARWGDHEFAALVIDVPPARLQELSACTAQALNANSFDEDGATLKARCHVASAVVDRNSESGQKTMAQLFHATEPAAPAAAPKATATPAEAAPGQSAPAAAASAAKPAAPSSQTAAQAPAAATDDWQRRIQQALEHEAFALNYQPIINLHGDAAEYFEVLVRMVGEDGQLVPAAHFMPVAERSGQSTAIDRWVVHHAIQALAELHRQQRRALFFINVSATALQDVDMVLMIQRWLNENAVRAKYVVLEVDESALLANPAAAAAFLRAASKVGCHFCIDNVGRSVEADAKLQDLPVQYLKIHSSLVRDAHSGDAAQAALKAVVDKIKAMERKAIAKGVESAGTLSVLWNLGVDYAQGHYFQQADGAPDYEFEDETTLSSDTGSPSWAKAQNKRR